MAAIPIDNYEDPFAAFGDVDGSDKGDDGDDDIHDDIDNFYKSDSRNELSSKDSIKLAQSLLATANKFNNSKAKDCPVMKIDETSESDSKHRDQLLRTLPKQQDLQEDIDDSNDITFPWHRKPLYIGPIRFVSSMGQFGGGRGCVARQELGPGTLILVEEPILSWSNEVNTNLTLLTIRMLLDQSNAEEILHSIEFFHPTRQIVNEYCLSNGVQDEMEIDNSIQEQIIEMMKYIEETLLCSKEDISSLNDLVFLAKSRGIHNSDGSSFNTQDILRIMLALRYNGLETGIYFYSALLNHSDQPNCVKFIPNPSDAKARINPYSEIRATKSIRKGEPLTISYIPTILCHASRRKYLWDQHRFDIGPNIISYVNQPSDDKVQNLSLRDMELIDGQFPSSDCCQYDDNSVTRRLESTIIELDAMYKEMRSIMEAGGRESTQGPFLEHCEALELSTLELCTESESLLSNHHHVLLIPCLQLHLDTSYLVQRHELLRSRDRIQLFGRMIRSIRHLIPLQTVFHGPDHYDLARSYRDLSQTIEIVLSKASISLLGLYENELKTIAAWTTLEYNAKQEYKRIQKLYPRDAARYIE